MSGAWVFVCGPSGVGKDSVIAHAQTIVSSDADIVFARRLVTRAAQAGSDHDPVTESDFSDLLQSGSLAWHWQAHGFYYGIAQSYVRDVQAGCLVVVNGSRAHVREVLPCAQVRVVQITAEPVQLALRLTQRARDSTSAIADRLARNARFTGMAADCLIVNDETLAVAGQQLADYLTTAPKIAAPD